MGTIITYKGEQLASFTGQTKTMLTSGKYMEDDVTITDTSSTLLPVGYAFGTYVYTDFGDIFKSEAEENI